MPKVRDLLNKRVTAGVIAAAVDLSILPAIESGPLDLDESIPTRRQCVSSSVQERSSNSQSLDSDRGEEEVSSGRGGTSLLKEFTKLLFYRLALATSLVTMFGPSARLGKEVLWSCSNLAALQKSESEPFSNLWKRPFLSCLSCMTIEFLSCLYIYHGHRYHQFSWLSESNNFFYELLE